MSPYPRKLSPEQEDKFCQRYLDGESARTLGVEHGFHPSAAYKVLYRHNIDIRPATERNKLYDCDHHFFDAIDTEAKAYFLGLMAADGCVVESKGKNPAMSLALHPKDKELLLEFKKALQSSHPITEHPQPIARLSIRSKQLATGLAKYSITPQKTYTVRWPKLPEPLYRHYLRGYFDGDGSWGVQPSRWHYPAIAFICVGNKEFLLGCQEYLVMACGLNKTKLYRSAGVYRMSYMGNRQLSRIFHLMYDGAIPFLKRKYQKVAPLLSGEYKLFY